GRNKGVIEDHFDLQYELQRTLQERGNKKAELAVLAEAQPKAGATSFTRQQEPLGLGHAVWCARELVGREPFVVLLPDVLVKASPSGTKKMVDAYRGMGAAANIMAVEEVPMDQVSSYGVVGVGERKGKSFMLTGMVEKPKPADAPSNLIITGRYILQPEIFDLLETPQKGPRGALQLTHALLRLLTTQPGYGFQFDGKTYDCGSKRGFLAANVAYALDRPDLAPGLREDIKALLG